MYSAEIKAGWKTLAKSCVLSSMKDSQDCVLEVPMVMKVNRHLMHLIRVRGSSVRRYVSQGSDLQALRVSIQPLSRTAYLGSAETRVCGVYKAACSTGCFIAGESASRSGVKLTVLADSLPAIKAFVRRLRSRDSELVIEKLGRMNGADGLTSRQEQALREAYKSGFFNYPHGTDLRHLAETLGCSAGTAAILLRKAEQKAIGDFFETHFL